MKKELHFSFAEPPIPEYDVDPLLPVDPEGCPRNREEAAARGRQCLRKCGSDADCISAKKRCLCDGLCGWSCIRPGKMVFLFLLQINFEVLTFHLSEIKWRFSLKCVGTTNLEKDLFKIIKIIYDLF